MSLIVVCFCKQRSAYEMRISDWSSDVCSSDLAFSIMVQPHLDSAIRPLLFGNGFNGFNGILDDISKSLPDLSPVTNNFARANIAVKCEGDKIGRASCRERVWQYV